MHDAAGPGLKDSDVVVFAPDRSDLREFDMVVGFKRFSEYCPLYKRDASAPGGYICTGVKAREQSGYG